MLDLNEHLFGGRVALTFIDPDMTRLRPLLRTDDQTRVVLIERRVQEVPLEDVRGAGGRRRALHRLVARQQNRQ